MTNSEQPQGISLKDYLSLVKHTLDSSPQLYSKWIIAEISDFRINRHAYMQLLEKDANGNTIATARATLWQSQLYNIIGKFQSATGSNLGNGMKVMFRVNVNMSELYGLSLNITDIYPEFTIGDMHRLRREIIERLTKEGIIDMNRELPLPTLPQRIAVISAAGAAGYGDFCNQIHNNSYGIKFYTCLFAATMQGQNTVPSVISALNRVCEHADLFDMVVIIRGGGATTDLNSFDNYDLAANVAQFELPIITGIGHERDTTVLDFVSAVPVKTPTAAAEWLISRCYECLQDIQEKSACIINTVTQQISSEKQHLDFIAGSIPACANNIIHRDKLRLSSYISQIPSIVSGRISTNKAHLDACQERISDAVKNTIQREFTALENRENMVNLLSPQATLNRGYSLTTVNGHAITDASQLKPGDTITTQLKSGIFTSQITEIK